MNSEGKVCTFNPIIDSIGNLMYSDENALSSNPQTLDVYAYDRVIFTLNVKGQ